MARINRKGKKNGARNKTKPGQSYRVYCPECPPKDMGHPENNVHISVDGTKPPTMTTCPAGHRFKVQR